LSPWFYAAFVHAPLRLLVGGMLVVLMALLLAIIFPVARRLDSPALMLGNFIPRVYAAAAGGAVLGVLLTESVLLDLLAVWNCFTVFAVVALGVSLFCFKKESLQPVDQVMMKLFVAVICGFIVLQEAGHLFSSAGTDVVVVNHSVKHEITVVKSERQGGIFIFGGERFDVQAGLDPLVGNDPALMLSLLRLPPKNILMIGLSARAWLKLVTQFPGVKNIDVVGLNLGHLAAINAYSRQKKLVMDARVHLSFDDERRWLKRHPRYKYDLIVENTACYWRACATKLLSREFNALTRASLQGAGVVAYNAVGARYVLSVGVG
jgi:predicted membrane-bound spermidine synthase